MNTRASSRALRPLHPPRLSTVSRLSARSTRPLWKTTRLSRSPDHLRRQCCTQQPTQHRDKERIRCSGCLLVQAQGNAHGWNGKGLYSPQGTGVISKLKSLQQAHLNHIRPTRLLSMQCRYFSIENKHVLIRNTSHVPSIFDVIVGVQTFENPCHMTELSSPITTYQSLCDLP